MTRLLHIIDSLGSGGAERLVVDTIKGMPDWEHHLIILNGPTTLQSELPQTCHFTNLNRRGTKDLLNPARQVRRYIKRHRISIVHSHLYYSSVIARLATPRNVPLLNSIHIISSLDNYSNSRLALWLEKLTYKRRHHILAVSQEALKDFNKWVGIKGKADVLYNFVRDEFTATQIKSTVGINPLRLVAVGNLRPQKNYPFLIEAFKRMPANVTLDIYGEGPLAAELENEIGRYKLPIRLLGSQQNLHKLLPAYDAYVMCSLFEGQPLSLLEAIASGLPALLADIPVLREVTGEDAVYFELGDPADFVKKVEQIIVGEIDIVRCVEPARKRIAAFSSRATYLQNLAGIYRRDIEEVKAGV